MKEFQEGAILEVARQAGWPIRKIGSTWMGPCPVCGKGHRTPNTSYDPERNCFHCFACGASGGVKRLCELLGVDFPLSSFSPSLHTPSLHTQGVRKMEEKREDRKEERKSEQKEERKIKIELEKLIQPVTDDEEIEKYLNSRGIDLKRVKDYVFSLVSIPQTTDYLVSQGYRLVIPSFSLSDGKIVSLKLRNTAGKDPKTKNLRGISPRLIIPKNLEKIQEAVLVVEGEVDFLSAIQIGIENVVAVPQAKYSWHEEEVQAMPATVVILFDADEAGREGAEYTARQLYRKGRKIYIAEYPDGYKDMNELLCAVGAEEARKMLAIQIQKAFTKRYIPFETDFVACQNILQELEQALEEAERQGLERPRPVIFKTYTPLDELLNGGLRSGTYMVAGMPSAGKTNFLLALAMNMARHKQKVIFFSLEMSKKELHEQELSFLSGVPRYKIHDKAVSREELAQIKQALEKADFLENLIIRDSIRTVDEMRRLIVDIMNYEGEKVIVIIDYLQVMQHPAMTINPRQALKEIAYQLKDIANTYEIPVVIISSVAREIYMNKKRERDLISVAKESGDIEYSVYVSLFLDHLSEEEQAILNTEKHEKVFKVILTKNRHGPNRDENGQYFYKILGLNFTNGTIRKLELEEEDGFCESED